jgi:prepilin-type N-terminal cleavage/methylation domain-containing protein
MSRSSSAKICHKVVQGFTLIEVVIAVVVLAIAVPPTLNLMDSASAGRVDAVNTTRATYLTTVVLETIIADMTSTDPSLGFEALSDSNAYLNTVSTGLFERLSTLTEPYISVGLKYSVTIGALVASDGLVSETESENVFRTVTVNVGFTSASTTSYQMPTSIMLSEM